MMLSKQHYPSSVIRLLFGIGILCAGASTFAGEVVKTTPTDGYRGIWYHIGKNTEPYGHKYSGGLATYCAKHSSFAEYRPEVEKTFFVYGGTTEDSNTSLLHMVAYYDHRTGQVSKPRVLLDKHTNDAHDNPVMSIDGDGHIWVFSTSHGRGRPSYIHRSAEPYSIDQFELVDATYESPDGQKQLDNFSYMQVWQSPSTGFVCFFTRYSDPANRTNMFMTSRDGQAWSTWRRLAAIEEGHYQVSAVEGNRFATAFDYHPNGLGLDYRTNLYYLQSTDGGEQWTTAAGESINTPVTSPDSPCLIHDFKSEGKNVYVKDLRFDASGAPVALVVTSKGHEPGPENGPYSWELFRWEEEQWRHSVICESDHNYDMGSLFFEPNRWRVIAPTDPGPQPFSTGGDIVSWSSEDLGKTWIRDGALTKSSSWNHSFVRRPLNAHDDFYALWADGDVKRPSGSRLYFCNRAGDVFQMPSKMTEELATPIAMEKPRREKGEKEVATAAPDASPHQQR